MNIKEFLAEATGQVLDKPILNISSVSLNFYDFLIMVVIVFVAYFCHNLFKLLMAVQVKRSKIKKAQSKTLSQLAGYIISIVALAGIFSHLGYSFTYILLGSTALLVGLGFGLQQLFVDLISGVILLIDKNVNYGDVISVDVTGGKEIMKGRIVQIGLRTTLLENIDNEVMIVPNSKVLSSGVRSLMRSRGSARFRIDIQVNYKADMEKVKGVLAKIVLENKNVDKTPEPTVIIKSFNDNGVLLEIRFWMKELFNSENILSEIRFEILKNFAENNIEIPFPQRVVHAKS